MRLAWREASGGMAAVVLAAFLIAVTAAAAPGPDDHAGSDPTMARMDALWAHRDRNDAMQELVGLGTNALAGNPHSFDAEWRLARAYFWVAYTQPSRVAKKAIARQAMEWADHARTDRPDRVEGHYFYAIAAGEYANTIGAAQAMVEGIAGKVESAALRAYAIDRNYYHGAPGTVLGRYYFMLPWPMRDLARSRRYLEEVVAHHPDALIARDYLADTYYDLGKPEMARTQLTAVLTSDLPPGTDLDLPSPKSLARESMARWFPEAVSGGQPHH